MNFEKMCEQINACFENKDVNAHVCKGGGFALRIEERDIQFSEDLQFVGQGTDLTYQPPS